MIQATTRQEAERRIVGLLLMYPELGPEAFDGLSPQDFQNGDLGKIFEAAKIVHDSGKRIEQMNIRQVFQSRGNLPNWLNMTFVDCMSDATRYPNAVQDCKEIILSERHFSEFKRLAGRAKNLEDALEASRKLLEWQAGVTSPDETPWPDIVEQAIERQRRISDGEVSAGYGWGIPELDRHTLLQPGKLYVVGGIKKGAKTLFVLAALQHNLAETPPVPCMLFTLEMSRDEIARRVLSTVSGIDSRRIFTSYLATGEVARLSDRAQRAKSFPLTVNDSATLGSTAILARALRWKYRNDIPDGSGIVVVDFIQLVEHDRRKAESEASAIKRVAYDLARMAKDLKTAVIAVAQLRNEGEGEKPHLRFLEGSGGIAQAAEAILLVDLVHRRSDGAEIEMPCDFNIVISAQRTGESGRVVYCKADLRTGQFHERTAFDG